MRSQPARILLIDHDPEIADRLRQLQPAGDRYSFTLEFVGNLEDGLQRLAGGEFDLLILGLSLPDVSGLEACQVYVPDASRASTRAHISATLASMRAMSC